MCTRRKPRDRINRDWENRPEGGGVKGIPAAFGEGQALPTPWSSVLFQGTQSVVLVLQQPRKETHVSEWFIFDEIPKMYWLGKNVSPMFTHFISLEGLQKFLSWDWYGTMIHISILDVFGYNYKGAALLTNDPSILLYLGLKGYQTERSPSLCRAQQIHDFPQEQESIF